MRAPIAQDMDLGDLYGYIVEEMHHNCVAELWSSPEEADWIDKNCEYFGFGYGWLGLGSYLETMLDTKIAPHSPFRQEMSCKEARKSAWMTCL